MVSFEHAKRREYWIALFYESSAIFSSWIGVTLNNKPSGKRSSKTVSCQRTTYCIMFFYLVYSTRNRLAYLNNNIASIIALTIGNMAPKRHINLHLWIGSVVVEIMMVRLWVCDKTVPLLRNKTMYHQKNHCNSRWNSYLIPFTYHPQHTTWKRAFFHKIIMHRQHTYCTCNIKSCTWF